MKKIILGCIFAAIVMISSLAFMTNEDLTTRSGDEWQLIWSDEFEGPELNTNFWNRQVEKAGRFNEEWQRYTNKKANAYLENNCLVIEAIHHGKKHGMDQYSSARLNTAGKFTFKYGKVSARIKLPYGMGIWPAFWMLGANIDENGGDTSWPLCGEIDILELYGAKNDAVVEANIHYADASGRHAMMGSESFELDRGIFADDFHLFELEWTPKTISWSVDGKTYASTSIASEEFSEFHKEFFLLLNIAVGGSFAGRPDSSSVFPQKMYVDWIRVYQKPE
jgi:beta-glucanase (GH16 family)